MKLTGGSTEDTMNEKFFALPKEKQQAIINAGYRVFSQNTYRKTPVAEVAAEAGISKSLLFHYFKNKKELYLFLWENCARITIEYLTEYGSYDKEDFFEMIYSGMQAKIRIMEKYPHMGDFTVKAFYEEDPEVRDDIRKSYAKYKSFKADGALAKLDPDKFVPGLDLQMMHREIYLAAEGYLWEMMQRLPIDVEKMEADFTQMIEFWKSIYLKKEE